MSVRRRATREPGAAAAVSIPIVSVRVPPAGIVNPAFGTTIVPPPVWSKTNPRTSTSARYPWSVSWSTGALEATTSVRGRWSTESAPGDRPTDTPRSSASPDRVASVNVSPGTRPGSTSVSLISSSNSDPLDAAANGPRYRNDDALFASESPAQARNEVSRSAPPHPHASARKSTSRSWNAYPVAFGSSMRRYTLDVSFPGNRGPRVRPYTRSRHGSWTIANSTRSACAGRPASTPSTYFGTAVQSEKVPSTANGEGLGSPR